MGAKATVLATLDVAFLLIRETWQGEENTPEQAAKKFQKLPPRRLKSPRDNKF
jgi:hypothetical protein